MRVLPALPRELKRPLMDASETAFDGRQLTIVGVLTGSVVLMADLIRHIDQPMRVGVIQASSYRGAT